MLVGTAAIDALAAGAPELESFDTEALRLEEVQSLQVMCEATTGRVEACLPPSLHPTAPGLLSWLIQHVPASPWGALTLAQTRLECRSGLRPRAFLLRGVVDNADAADELGRRWGYNLALGSVSLERNYDRISAQVRLGQRPCLELELRDPEPLQAAVLQYVANMNLALTPRGPRLVQVDPDVEVLRAERGRPEVLRFDGAAFGAEGLDARYPVSASFSVANVTLPRLRFLCRPEELAFIGTEQLGGRSKA